MIREAMPTTYDCRRMHFTYLLLEKDRTGRLYNADDMRFLALIKLIQQRLQRFIQLGQRNACSRREDGRHSCLLDEIHQTIPQSQNDDPLDSPALSLLNEIKERLQQDRTATETRCWSLLSFNVAAAGRCTLLCAKADLARRTDNGTMWSLLATAIQLPRTRIVNGERRKRNN